MSEAMEIRLRHAYILGERMVWREMRPQGHTPRLDIVLVHGLGVSGRYLLPTAELLATRHRVYVPDLPGFGLSSRPRHVLGVEEQAETLATWMPEVPLDRAVFIGNSMGCQVIAELAARYPERVQALGLIGTTFDPRALTAPRQIYRLFLDIFRERVSHDFLAAYDYLSAGPRRTWRTFRKGMAHDLRSVLPRVQAPVVVMRGERDPICPQPWAEEVARLLPRATLRVLHGAAHAANYSAPDLVVAAMQPLLNELEEAPREVTG